MTDSRAGAGNPRQKGNNMAAQLKQKTHKVAEIETGNGFDLQIVRDYTRKEFPFLVYFAYYDTGWHKRKINEFHDMVSAMRYAVYVIEGRVRI